MIEVPKDLELPGSIEKFVNAIADPLFVKDRHHRWVLLNDAMSKLMDADKDKLIGKSDYDFFTKEEADVFWEMDEKVFTSGKENLNEENFTDKNGTQYRILTHKSLYKDDNGTVFLIGTIRNITDRVRLEEEHRKSFKDLAFLKEAAMDFIELAPNINPYQIIAENLQRICGENALIFVSSYNTEKNFQKVEGFAAESIDPAAIFSSLKLESSIEFPLASEASKDLHSGKLMLAENGLTEITNNALNQNAIDQFEKQFNIKAVYGIGLSKKKNILGSAAIILMNDPTPPDAKLVEAYCKQAVVALQKSTAELELNEERERLKQLVLRNPYAIAMTDQNGIVTNINEAFSRMLKKKLPDDFVLLPSDLIPEEFKNIRNRLAKGEEIEIPLWKCDLSKMGKGFPQKDLFIRSVIFPIHISVKEEARYVFMVEDLTENIQMADDLLVSEERFKNLFDYANDIIFTLDFEGNFTSINKKCSDLLGFEIKELVGKSIDHVLKGDSKRMAWKELKRKLKEPEVVSSYQIFAVSKQGKRIPLEVHSFMRNNNNVPREIFGIARDITERIENEKELKAALKEKEILLREVHHRVKNNLQVIVSLINMHLKDLNDPQVQEKLTDLQARVMTMSFVHEDLYLSKDLSNIEFSRYLRKLVNNLFLAYDIGASIKKHTDTDSFNLDIEKAIPCGLLLNEIITNSLKYAFPADFVKENKEEPSISISVKEEKNKIAIHVSDNGVGFKMNEKSSNKSLGLQLMDILVKDQLKGSITHKNTKGTSYTIRFKP